MPAVFINGAVVILGGLLGLLAGRLLKPRYNQAAMTALALCTLYIGFDGALKGQNPLITIVALVVFKPF